ncbi:MAG TPA: 3-hydroxyacyl-CoA dehydrogenase [Parvularculaceae bacterium]|nr:3-hydroxyacyl-CoA dehydrogenase [Parvularculaceae bacterium]
MLNEEVIVGVVGAGAMGAGIAQVAAQAGHRVIVLDQFEEALSRGKDSIAKGLDALVKRGKIAEGEAKAIAARCGWTLDVADFSEVGLVIEAVVENSEVKRALFQQVEDVVAGDAVIATNTSSLSVTALASGHKNPGRYMGLHFFNPAPIMKLVEVISGAETDEALATSALDLMKSWGKTAVMARDVPGFIVNRVARPFYGEGWRALEEGAADAATIDFLYRDLAGFRMGPFELGDLIGHDINTAAAKSVFDAYFGRTRFTPSLMQGQLVDAGRLGRKSGVGVFNYADGEKPTPNFAAEAGASGDDQLLQKLIVDGAVEHGGVRIMKCDGRTALHVAAETQGSIAVIDFIRDPAAATAIAFAASDDTADAAARSFIAANGKKAVRLKDRPGLVVYRTLLQLANGAADAVRDQVASPEAIDVAMMNGVNYPFGPVAWARGEGLGHVVDALDAVAEECGEAMYRPGEWLRAAARRGLL